MARNGVQVSMHACSMGGGAKLRVGGTGEPGAEMAL